MQEKVRKNTNLGVESEVTLGAVLPRDHAVPAINPGDHRALELRGRHHLHRHDGLQETHGRVLHRCRKKLN